MTCQIRARSRDETPRDDIPARVRGMHLGMRMVSLALASTSLDITSLQPPVAGAAHFGAWNRSIENATLTVIQKYADSPVVKGRRVAPGLTDWRRL